MSEYTQGDLTVESRDQKRERLNANLMSAVKALTAKEFASTLEFQVAFENVKSIQRAIEEHDNPVILPMTEDIKRLVTENFDAQLPEQIFDLRPLRDRLATTRALTHDPEGSRKVGDVNELYGNQDNLMEDVLSPEFAGFDTGSFTMEDVELLDRAGIVLTGAESNRVAYNEQERGKLTYKPVEKDCESCGTSLIIAGRDALNKADEELREKILKGEVNLKYDHGTDDSEYQSFESDHASFGEICEGGRDIPICGPEGDIRTSSEG